MSKEQQTLTRAALEMTPESDSIRELKRITVKLFDNQVQESNDVCAAMESSENEEEGEEAAEWEFQSARSKTGKNRGGSLQKSIKSTQNLYGFKGNSKGASAGRSDNDANCRNCGASGHWWRNCPNLLKKPVIFNRAKGNSKKGGKKNTTSAASSKGPSQTLVASEESAASQQENGEVEPDDVMEVSEQNEMFVGEYGEDIDDFYDSGNWNGTFVMVDVLESSSAFESTYAMEGQNLMYGMIDSGASLTVCGSERYDRWMKGKKDNGLQVSDKQFRFGDGRIVQSIGRTALHVNIPSGDTGTATIRLHADVVVGKVPLLISYGSLHRAKCVMGFYQTKISFENTSIKLRASPRGHIYIPMLRGDQERNAHNILPVSRELGASKLYPLGESEITPTKLHRLHVHLGHASPNMLMKILNQAKLSVDVNVFVAMVSRCGCDQLKFGFQRPIVHSNKPLKCGSHVEIDAFYPVPNTNMRIPYLLMICMMSRFALAAALDSHRPRDAIEVFFNNWRMSMGKPTRLISDRRKSFMGPEWHQFLSAFAIEHVMTAPRSQHENGKAERAIALVKTAFMSMRSTCPTLSNNRLVSWACMIKNLTPMLGAGVSPSQVMLGGNNFLESLENAQWVENDSNNDITHTVQFQIQSALEARSLATLEDAKRAISLGMNRPIRAGAKQEFRIGDVAQLFIKEEDQDVERRTPGFRIVAVTSHHIVVERGGTIQTPQVQSSNHIGRNKRHCGFG